MQKVVEFLQKNPVQYLATVGRDGKAKCRPFMFCFEQDGKLRKRFVKTECAFYLQTFYEQLTSCLDGSFIRTWRRCECRF